MRRVLLGILVVVAVVILVFTAFRVAQASVETDWEKELNAECVVFHDHSGFIPGSYDVAVLIEDGYTPQVVKTNGQDIYVPPPYGRKSWDTVLKCKYRDSTTTTSETTTTLGSTTTEGSTTTTQGGSSTTTVDSTTTTGPTGSSTTTIVETTTTGSGITTTTIPSVTTSTEGELPSTGLDVGSWVVSALVLIAGGVGLVWRRTHDDG